MSLTLTELKTETAETYKNLTLQDWKVKSDYRGITKRSQKDFDNLIPMYIRKIDTIREQLRGDWSVTLIPITNNKLKTPLELGNELAEQLQYLLEKETRLIDKFTTCIKEVEMRKDGDVVRTDLHDQANYYIDYGGGNDANDGLSTGNAWKTITKYTKDTVRTAGDIAYLRANITWSQGTEAVSINFDEDGDQDNYIKIIGCDSVTNDPWSDGSDVLPIIDFEDLSYNIILSTDQYWWLERLDAIQSSHASGTVSSSGGSGTYLKDCVIRDVHDAATEGFVLGSGKATLDGCSFQDCGEKSLYLTAGIAIVKSCTFNGGAGIGTSRGLYSNGGTVYISDSTFGVTTAHSGTDLRVENGGTVYARNCTWTNPAHFERFGGSVFSEDDDATFESHITTKDAGIITRDTGTVRAGGADSSAKMEPNAGCGVNEPLVLGHPLSGFARIWATKDVEINLTVYAAVGSAWDSALTAAECYAKFSYLNHAVNATRTEVNSTEQITNDTNFTALTSGNFTPLQTGWVYVWLYLEEYEDATEHIFVDLKVA